MNKKLIILSIIALCTINNNAKSYQGLEISKPFDTISNKQNMVIDNIKQNINDNMSVKSLTTNDNSIINGVKNTINNLKTQISLNKIDNSNNNEIIQNKSQEKTESTFNKTFNKQEERQAIKMIRDAVKDYLKKKNIKLFVANTKEKLDKYTNELKKKHSYNMVVLDKMLIDSTLCDILKSAPQYKNILSNNINYNILVSLFAVNANENKEILNDITKELDRHHFNLQVFSKIRSIYNEANTKINEKLKNTEQSKNKKKLTIENNNSFSVIENKKEENNNTIKFDNLKINPKIKMKLSTLKNEDKSALLDDFSDVLNSNDDIKINNQSVDQYFKSSSNLNTDQKLYDIIYSLVSVGIFSHIISLFNPFSSSISLINTILTPVVTSLPNSKPVVSISTTSYISTAYYSNFFGFGGFGYLFSNLFNFMPSFGFGTMFMSSFF